MRRAALQPAQTAPLATPLLLGAVLGGLLLVRLIALRFNATDLFFDEAQYWSWGREPAFGYYSKPPLIAWIIGLTTKVCGDSTFCIRLPAPILHTATAVLIYLTAKRLHDARVGLWAALAFATLPGVSLSAGIISTDIPLLLCWALALWGFVALLEDDGWWPAIVLGLGIGLGMNAKYAMVFFVGSAAIYLAATPPARRLLSDVRLWAALGIGALLIAPNMAWNLSNSFATFAHTADNAKWGGSLLNAAKGLEFVAAQLGVFGPILFAALIATVLRAWREGLPPSDRLLLAFTLPVLVAITAQGFISRAHANWAATAYVAGSILVTSTLVRLLAERWLRASMALHALVLVVLALGTSLAGRFTLPFAGDPFQRTLGWSGLGQATGRVIETARVAGKPFRAVMADERALTAELLYYLRAEATPIVAWRDQGGPRDHYELTRPYKDPLQVPILLVSTRRDFERITRRFTKAELLDERLLPAGLGEPRPVRFISLSGYRPD